eukprot:2066002-Prorocentrum_lima.AAC.1
MSWIYPLQEGAKMNVSGGCEPVADRHEATSGWATAKAAWFYRRAERVACSTRQLLSWRPCLS